MPRSCKDTIIAAHHDEEDVDYTNLQRTSVDANGDLNTTSSQSLNQGWLSGASSVQTVNDDDYIEFEIENISTYNNNFLVGLSFQDNSTNLYESAYGFFVRNNGSVSIHLGSSTAVYTTSRSVGDKFRIERDNGTIRFKKNGVTIYSTTDTQQSTAMYADVSMWFQTGYVNRVYNLVVGKFVPETTKNVCYGNWQDASFGKYRYAYNGMEKDDEVSGNGNSYTTEFRQYDPRLGRWKSLDPLMAQFPWQSPYCAFDNNPVYYVDPYGLSAEKGGPYEDFSEGIVNDGDVKDSGVPRELTKFERFKNWVSGNRHVNKANDYIQANNIQWWQINTNDDGDVIINQSTYRPIASKDENGEPIIEYFYQERIKTFSTRKDEIIVMLDSDGAMGFGHLAIMIGNDKTGWTFLSKEGRNEDDDASSNNPVSGGPSLPVAEQNYNSLAEFLADENRKEYDKFTVFEVTPYTDTKPIIQKMRTEANTNYSFTGNNCGHAVISTLESLWGDVDWSTRHYVNKTHQKTAPESQYYHIKRTYRDRIKRKFKR